MQDSSETLNICAYENECDEWIFFPMIPPSLVAGYKDNLVCFIFENINYSCFTFLSKKNYKSAEMDVCEDCVEIIQPAVYVGSQVYIMKNKMKTGNNIFF